jgi:hypothetical protein
VSNVNSFLNGNFSAGGWPGLITLTTQPVNNPYGAYVSASIAINSAVNNAQVQKQQELLQNNGFLTFQQEQNCQPAADQNVPLKTGQVIEATPNANGGFDYRTCDVVNTTPGHVIASAIDKSLGQSQDELNFAQSFDAIVSALVTQLMTNALHKGLATLSGTNGYASSYYTADQLQAQQQSQGLAQQIQTSVTIAQQYASTEQGSIQDAETAQNSLTQVINCWKALATTAAADSTSTTTETASAAATQAQATFDQLTSQITAYNGNITRANQDITLLQQLETQALSASASADVQSAINQYNAGLANDTILSQTDLTNAQQDRTSLQQQLVNTNSQTTSSLDQCHASTP